MKVAYKLRRIGISYIMFSMVVSQVLKLRKWQRMLVNVMVSLFLKISFKIGSNVLVVFSKCVKILKAFHPLNESLTSVDCNAQNPIYN